MNAEANALVPSGQAEINAVADEMAKSYRNMVKYYMREYKMSPADAVHHVTERSNGAWIEQIMETSARQLSWKQIADLEEHDPALALKKWQEVKAEMREYVQSGCLAADVLCDTSPLERAKYSALLDSLCNDWQPRNGVEHVLMEQMALCLMRMLEWQRILSNWMGWLDQETEKEQMPRISTDAAIGRATEMIDRFNRMFLRTLRSLRDLRRYNNPVIVQNAGQVNVGGQQINVAPSPE